jgi:hypothetical protein
MRLLLPTVVLVVGLANHANAQSQSLFWWIVGIDKSERVTTAATPTFVLYGDQDSLELRWTFKNDEGTEVVSVVPATLQAAIKVNEGSGGRLTQAVLTWAPGGKLLSSGVEVPIGSQETLELSPGDSFEWSSVVRRQDSVAWTPGEYGLTIDMAQALSTLTSNGMPWRGRAASNWSITFRISQLNSLSSRKAALRLEGARELAAGNAAAAVNRFRAMVKMDPSDPDGYARLGHALMETGQYKEAVVALEVALPFALQDRSALPERLAYAYVKMGDDANATRVLRQIVPESQVPSRLARLRAAAKKP